MEKCKNCQKQVKKLVSWWIVEGNQNFKLCQKCSDKKDRKIWEEAYKKYKIDNPTQEKWVVEINWWKTSLFFSTITLLIILIVVLNKRK